jgi:hypothetical protein
MEKNHNTEPFAVTADEMPKATLPALRSPNGNHHLPVVSTLCVDTFRVDIYSRPDLWYWATLAVDKSSGLILSCVITDSPNASESLIRAVRDALANLESYRSLVTKGGR